MFAIVISLSMNTAYAATWEWINSDDETGYFFDSESIRYELNHDYMDRVQSVNPKRITYWKKIVYTPRATEDLVDFFEDDQFYNVRSSMSLETVSLSDKTITCYTVVFYDAESKVIYSEDGAGIVHKVVPESWDEEVLNAVSNYATAHKDLLTRNAYAED